VCAGGGAVERAEGEAVKLRLPEHFRWLLLRRVKGGQVARSREGWVRNGSPMSPFLVEFFEELLQEGLIEVADPSPEDCLSRVGLTEAGVNLYGALCKKQRAPVSPAE
jgi:hypothetical protein